MRDHAAPGPDELLAHAGFVRAVARRILLDDDRADDVVQETLLAALEAPHQPRSLRAWLAGTARNVARMMVRSDDRRCRREQVAAVLAARPERPDSIAARLESQRRLVEAVEALPEPFRETLVLRYFDGLSPAEIAAHVGVAETTVRTRTHRALALLREGFDAEHRGDRHAWSLALLPLAVPPRVAAPATATAAAVGGAIVMKKILVATAVLILLGAVVVWRAFPPDEPAGDGAPVRRETPVADVSTGEEEIVAPEPAAEIADPADPDRDRDLHGVVVDVAGRAIPGARIETFRRPWARTLIYDIERSTRTVAGPSAVADAQGRFAIRLRPGDVVNVRVSADGHAPRSLVGRSAGDRLRVILGAGATLVVRVHDEDGGPIARARVRVFGVMAPDDPVLVADERTGEDGRAEFRGLAAGMAGVWTTHPDFGCPYPRKVVIPETGAIETEVELTPGRTVRGRVVDAATGAPIGGARVGESTDFGRSTRTGADGGFVLEHWSGRLFPWLEFTADGYAAARRPVSGEPLEVALERGDAVEGRIVDAEDEPVAGALVSLVAVKSGSTNRDTIFDSRSAVSDDDGRFVVHGLRRDIGPHALIVQAPGHGKVMRSVPPREGGVGRIDLGEIALPLPRSIAGRVLDGGGEPSAGVPVELVTRGEVPRTTRQQGREVRITDDLGRFRFVDLAPGEYRVGGVNVTLTADRDVEEVTIRAPGGALADFLSKLRGNRTITFRVKDCEGRPLRAVRIEISGQSDGWTGHDGREMIEGLPAGPITVTIRPPVHDVEPRVLAGLVPEGQTVDVVLESVGQIRGRVLGPDDEPLSQMSVVGHLPGTRMKALAVTDAEGRFDIPLRRGTRADVCVSGDRWRPDLQGAERPLPLAGLVEGVIAPAKDVVVRCTRPTETATVSVLVRAPDGSPVEGARVDVSGRLDVGKADFTGSDGRVRFDGLRSATVTLLTRRYGNRQPETWVGSAPVDVAPEGQEVELRFREGVFVTGVVRVAEGGVQKEALVWLYREGWLAGRARSGQDGRFRVVGLRGEEHELRVSSSGRSSVPRIVVPPVTDLEVVLPAPANRR